MYGSSNLRLNEGSRIAYQESPAVIIFTDGTSHKCKTDELSNVAKSLSDKHTLTSEEWSQCTDQESQIWLIKQLNNGLLSPETM